MIDFGELIKALPFHYDVPRTRATKKVTRTSGRFPPTKR
jgi:hypothetical protein